jgi:Ca2+-binding EF-hand superfamily protein
MEGAVVRLLIVGLWAASATVGSPAIAQQSGAAAQKPVTRAQLESRLDASFAEADANHDGFLSANELQVMQQKGMQQVQARARQELQARFNQLDTNKDGKLSFDEFVAIATVRPNQTPEQILQKLDTNHDGKVSPAEAKAPELGAFNNIDTNHDGVLSPAEINAARQKR